MARRRKPAPLREAAGLGAYHGYAELLERWRRIGTPRVVGESVAGVPLHALELGPPDAPRVSAIMAGIHPIEWIGVEVMLALLERLAAAPPADRRVIAFPLVNVDGYRRVEANVRNGRRRFVRGNENRVDLNRNWPVSFAQRRLRRGLFGDYNHGGAYPCSEPEVAAIVDALDAAAARATIDVALSLHSIGRMILVPYGGRWAPPADAARLLRAAHAIRARLPRRYGVRQSARWVPGAFARGMEIDTLHDRYGATAILVECTWGGARLLDPRTWRHPFRIFNPPDPAAEIAELAAALEPFARGAD
jgi:predicted deacylase